MMGVTEVYKRSVLLCKEKVISCEVKETDYQFNGLFTENGIYKSGWCTRDTQEDRIRNYRNIRRREKVVGQFSLLLEWLVNCEKKKILELILTGTFYWIIIIGDIN